MQSVIGIDFPDVIYIHYRSTFLKEQRQSAAANTITRIVDGISFCAVSGWPGEDLKGVLPLSRFLG